MVHTPSTRLNAPLRCSQGAAAGVLKPLWALRFGVVLGVSGVLGVEVLGGVLGVGGGGSGRRLWIGKWIIDLGALPALGSVLGGQGGEF